MGFVFCLFTFTICYVAARRSLVGGLIATLAVGYLFGITKANLTDTSSYFVFDAGVLGLYAAQMFRPVTQAIRFRIEGLRAWTEVLVLWPVVVFFFPFQDLMIRLVGLRSSIFLLPFLLLGAKLEPEERYKLALGLAALNLLALGFACAEYFLGVEQFFPQNPLTKIIYMSRDVAEHAYRIPATFANAHAYGGAMVVTLPFIAGAMLQRHKHPWQFTILVTGLAAAVLGVLFSATRLTFAIAAVLIVILTFSIKSRISHSLGWLTILAVIAVFVSGAARLQRFTELQNTEMVSERVGGSVNMTFFELATKYPFGNGLGGGGSNIPAFLQDRIQNPVTMENEYARIMLEQGIFGLILWIGFLTWLFLRPANQLSDSWGEGRRLARWACILVFGIGLLGIGTFVTVPQTCLLLICAGWLAARQKAPAESEVRDQTSEVRVWRSKIGYAN